MDCKEGSEEVREEASRRNEMCMRTRPQCQVLRSVTAQRRNDDSSAAVLLPPFSLLLERVVHGTEHKHTA